MIEEVVADKGYHSNQVMVDLEAVGVRSYISEPDRGRRKWTDNPEARDAVYRNRGRIRGALPELNTTWFGFGATPAELRTNGLVAALDQVTREKTGVMVLGLPLQMRFNVYLRKPIHGANLGGLKLRGTPSMTRCFAASARRR